MASSFGRQTNAITEEMSHPPQQHEFFQLIRLLKKRACAKNVQPSIRLKSNTLLKYPATAVDGTSKIQSKENANKHGIEVINNFIGLTGQSGVLPKHLTIAVLEQISNKDFSLNDFFEIFNQRILTLFHTTCESGKIHLEYESSPSIDSSMKALNLLLGLASSHTNANTVAMQKDTLLFYSGLFAKAARPAGSLAAILEDHFNLPVKISNYTGEWLEVQKHEQTNLTTRGASRKYNELGISTMLGQKVWLAQNRFTICIGPIHYDEYQGLLPNKEMQAEIRNIIGHYISHEFSFSIRVLVEPRSVPTRALKHNRKQASQLGWNAWLTSPSLPVIDKDIILPSTQIQFLKSEHQL